MPFLSVCFASFAYIVHVSDVANEVETVSRFSARSCAEGPCVSEGICYNHTMRKYSLVSHEMSLTREVSDMPTTSAQLVNNSLSLEA